MQSKRHDDEAPVPVDASSQAEAGKGSGAAARSGRGRKGAAQELVPRLPVADDELLGLLDDARKAAATELDPAAHAREHEAAIAHLECELAARGIDVAARVAEPMPGRVAFAVFLKALASQDGDAAVRAIRTLPHGALWLACRRIRESGDRPFRIHCLASVLYRLDVCFLGAVAATVRQEWIADSRLEERDLEALVEQCLASMFGTVFSYAPRTGEDHDAR